MPLMKPEIQQALQLVGMLKKPAETQTLEEKMDEKGLSQDDLLENLSTLMNCGSNDGIKQRAIETALKIRGLMKDQTPTPPAVTIVINDQRASAGEVNKILIPRQVPSEAIQ